MANVLAYTEFRDGQVGKAARGVVAASRHMADLFGGEAHAVAFGVGGDGAGGPGAAGELGPFGADRVFLGEHESMSLPQPDMAAAAIARLVEGGEYRAVLFPATAGGKDLAPRVAARLGRGLATDVVRWETEDDSIVVRRPMYAGKAIATLKFSEGPALMTLRATAYPSESREAAGEVSPIDVDEGDARVRVSGFEQGDGDRLDVADATIIVAGGRGMQGPEHWNLLEDLVAALGDEAALGASRAVVDAGWRPHSEQVGQTGKTVSPSLYIAVGISGAIQHLAGMRTAKVIVAVNRDADAPIFGVADYGLVGDVFEVLPPLAAAIREARQGE